MRKQNLIAGMYPSITALFFLLVGIPSLNAQTIYFQDDFESGIGNWVVSGKDWNVVTNEFRSSAHSFHDNPQGIYSANANAIATLLNPIDLSKAESPQVTFWTKHNIQDPSYWGITDDGRIEISQDGGITWKQISEYYGFINSWYQVKLDLSSYKSKPILIRFRLTSDGPGEQHDGWYIDDIEISEKNTLPSLSVLIEPTGSGTVTGNGINCPGKCERPYPFSWVVSGKDWAITDSDFRSGSRCIHDHAGSKYSPYANEVITLSNAIDISSSTSPQLRFWTKHVIQDPSYWGITDDGRVEVSQDGGLTWEQIAEYNGNISSWYSVVLDLTKYRSKPILIRFRLTADGPGEEHDGWYIDDVEVKDFATSKSYFVDDFENSLSLPGKYTLTANPSGGNSFSAWTSCDASTGNQCTANFYLTKTVKATFTGAVRTLKEDLLGIWSGTVWQRNSDTGEWTSPTAGVVKITTGDFDGDGRDDLVGVWPGNGTWVKYSKTGVWEKLGAPADWISTGDLNGDGKPDLLGVWEGSIKWRDSATGTWTSVSAGASKVVAGDLDDDGKEDIVGDWPAFGVWVKNSGTGNWAPLSSRSESIATGKINSDAKADLIGIWDSTIYWRDSATGTWEWVAAGATQVVSGDIDGDSKDDIVGIWPTSGVWVRYAANGKWERLSASVPDFVAIGRMR